MSESLAQAKQRYRQYGDQALARQRLYRGGRLVVLLLGLGAAVAGAARITLPDASTRVLQALDRTATLLPLLAIGLGFLVWVLRFARQWVAFRAGAEAIKAEAFLYATSAEKYATEDRDALLNRRAAEIGRMVERMRQGQDDKEVERYVPSAPSGGSSFPDGALSEEDYLRRRVDDQIAYYVGRAGQHGRVAFLFQIVTVGAYIGAAVLGHLHIDAWVAVLTTLSGSLSAYAAVRADDFLASSYRATARNLLELSRSWKTHEYPHDLPAFAAHVEQVLMMEHGGWMALVRHLSAGEMITKK